MTTFFYCYGDQERERKGQRKETKGKKKEERKRERQEKRKKERERRTRKGKRKEKERKKESFSVRNFRSKCFECFVAKRNFLLQIILCKKIFFKRQHA